GKSISGFRLNEDTYSIQLRDAAGELISWRKADLADIRVSRASTMPPFGGANAETDDLIAYLVSLRRK
ncbi:MAG: hypothetical protein GY953_38230, partial [bacterium]|nr:hypothetical protein [bacterium]